jgi:hypothetical protein
MKYIIDMISIDQLKDIIDGTANIIRYATHIKYHCLIEILIIDKFNELDDKSYITIINNNYIHNIKSHSFYIDDISLVVECYYIIKCMTQEEGRIHMINRNKTYNELCDKNITDMDYINRINAMSKVHNELLEYYLKPRGTLTKSAII